MPYSSVKLINAARPVSGEKNVAVKILLSSVPTLGREPATQVDNSLDEIIVKVDIAVEDFRRFCEAMRNRKLVS